MTRKQASRIGNFTLAIAVAIGSPGMAWADQFITNGGFETYTPGTSGPVGNGSLNYSPVANWTLQSVDSTGSTPVALLYTAGSGDTTGSYYNDTANPGVGTQLFKLWGPGTGSSNGLTASSPDGGNFLALDADPQFDGTVSQTVTGLTAGQTYTLSFDWAGSQIDFGTSATTEQLQVSFAGQTQSTAVVNNAAEGFTGWMTQTMTFTADGTSDTLSFLAVGGPANVPPIVLLDAVSLTGPAAVPEPGSLILVGLGLLGAGAFQRMRKRTGLVPA